MVAECCVHLVHLVHLAFCAKQHAARWTVVHLALPSLDQERREDGQDTKMDTNLTCARA